MKAVIQRVTKADVSVDNECLSSIGKGLVVYLGVERGDNSEKCLAMALKIVNLRIFEDDNGKMNKSLLNVQGEILLISQFTLCANCSRGNRPDFLNAEDPKIAKALYEECGKILENAGVKVGYGRFGADMTIRQTNAGPVTIVMEK